MDLAAPSTSLTEEQYKASLAGLTAALSSAATALDPVACDASGPELAGRVVIVTGASHDPWLDMALLLLIRIACRSREWVWESVRAQGGFVRVRFVLLSGGVRGRVRISGLTWFALSRSWAPGRKSS